MEPNTIKNILTPAFPMVITPKLVEQLTKMVMLFEIRGEHPLTLNSQLFGVNKFAFTAQDRQMFFDILNICEEDVNRIIKRIPSINSEFKVISDAFNIMSVYMAHCILASNLSVNAKHDGTIAVLNYMQYRLIGSVINHYFPHGANHDIMQTVVENLNMKFSVRQLGSWKNVVVDRSESLAFDTKAHKDTLLTFDNDKNILYLISDTSTRIRSQFKIITGEYYETRKTNNYMVSHSSTTILDGVRILRESDSSFSTISGSVFDKILVKSSFIDERYVDMVQKTIPRLNVSIIRRMLSAISDEAKFQSEKGTTHVTQKHGATELYIGIEALIEHIIHVIYFTAINNKQVNINNKISVYTHVKNIFSAARTSNNELMSVRSSIDYLFRHTHVSTRESTISGLGIVLALYLTLMSFNTV